MTLRTFRRILVSAIAVILAALLPITAAGAHDRLESTIPADGAVLTEPPAAVVFSFAAPPLDIGGFISARSASGEAVGVGPAAVDGLTVSATWPSSARSGTYLVSWRVVSGDGHPVSGAITFRISGQGGSAPAATLPTVAQDESSFPPGPVAALMAIGLVGAGLVSLMMWRRRS